MLVALALTGGCLGSSKPATSQGDASRTRGGVLRYLSEHDVEHLDPGRVRSPGAADFARLLHRTLMTYTDKKGAAGSRVVPDLAVAPGVPSDGARTWTYQLKHGQRYEDGSEITAQDVQYGVERTFAAELAAGPTPYRALLVGAAAYRGPYTGTAGLPSIAAPDRYTIVFRFAEPFAEADLAAALPSTAPVPRAQDTRARYDQHPLSSGPYRIRSYLPGASIDLVRNPYWDPKSSPAIGAYPDEVQGELRVEGPAIDRRLAAGDGRDATAVTDKAALDPGSPADGDRLFRGPDGSVLFSAMDTARGPFRDLKVRQALEVAYPVATARIAAGGPAAGDFATDLLPPSLPSHQDLDAYGQRSRGYDGDPTRAKQLLVDAGYPQGVTITALAYPAGPSLQVASAVRAALAPAGFRLQVTTVDQARYDDAVGRPARQPDLVDVTWVPDLPSAAAVLPPLFTCAALAPVHNRDPADLCDRSFDTYAAQALADTDPDERNRIWKALDRRLVEEAVVVPRLFGVTSWRYGKDVKNVRSALPFGGEIDLANLAVK